MEGAPLPPLSVIAVIVSDTIGATCDTSHLEGCLQALADQAGVPDLEVIVPYHPATRGIEPLQRRFPRVQFVLVPDLTTYAGPGMGSREHHDELRARGLALARGAIIGLLEDHARPDPHWAARVLAAHEQRYAAVGGAIENGIDRALNWAVYFCDFGRYQNPVEYGESAFVSDANSTYKRTALEMVRSSWQQTFHETTVNRALTMRGESLALAGDVIVFQHRTGLRLGTALRERFVWGRSYAAGRSRLVGGRRFIYAALSPSLPVILLTRMGATVIRKRRRGLAFLRALPLTALLTVSWSCGELAGYVTGRATSKRR